MRLDEWMNELVDGASAAGNHPFIHLSTNPATHPLGSAA